MKKALIVGGSNGIGLAISKDFIRRGYEVIIFDISKPDVFLEEHVGKYKYHYCNLLDFDEDQFCKIAEDENISCLMITAGFGRVADFEYLHTKEIENLIRVNTIAAMKIIRIFYHRIKNSKPFYCGIMASIAGLVTSPMFSVYAASKAAICRFVESVNIELEGSGVSNRILNVSPGSIGGTKFNGAKENQVELIEDLGNKIANHLLQQKTLYIPDYSKVYKGVIERYEQDSHSFGLSSYEYKKTSGRGSNKKGIITGYLSGTFDLFHIGHLNILRKAKEQCDYLVVGVHLSAAHKGKEAFIPFEERMQIVKAIKYVDKVVPACSEDSDTWDLLHYDKLFVGSDYKGTERFKRYENIFSDKNVKIVFFPYTQGTSSTQLRNLILEEKKDI